MSDGRSIVLRVRRIPSRRSDGAPFGAPDETSHSPTPEGRCTQTTERLISAQHVRLGALEAAAGDPTRGKVMDMLIGRREFTDGVIHAVFVDRAGWQYVVNDGEQVYGLWIDSDQEPDEPLIVARSPS